MRKQKSKALWIIKVLLVLLMIFSQLYAPLEVLAEELNNNEEASINETTNDENIEKQEENNTEAIDENKNENTNETTSEENNNKQPDTTTTPEDDNSTNPTENVPSEESTPEDKQETSVYTYKVSINDEETDEYTIPEGTKKITVKQSYDGEAGTYHFSNPNETEELDFTNKLYGNYKREYKVLSNSEEELDSKVITINYEGDNSEILNGYATGEVYVYEHTIIVDGKKDYLTVEEILSKFNLNNLETDYDAKLTAKDEEGNELSPTDYVTEKTIFVLSNDEVEDEFSIYVYGDYNNDKILNLEDAKKIVDIILETKSDTEEPIESIIDAGNTVYRTGIWDEVTEAKDELSSYIESKTEVYRGEEFEIKYFIKGFKEDKINGIQGKLNYNKEILELVSIEIDKIYGDINKEGTFAYLLDDYNSEDAIMTIKMKGIQVGSANVSIEDILASVGGIPANLDKKMMTTIEVIEAGKGGDVEEETTPATPQTIPAKPESVVKDSSSYIRPIAKSSDSKIKYLEIKGYKIDFSPEKYNYSIKVKNNVKSLDLTVVLNDSNATYEVFGNENFKVGENQVKIVVTAEDGSTSTYTINVTRAKKETKEEKEEKKSSKTIIVILIILVIIGLIYVIFKDDEEEEKK